MSTNILSAGTLIWISVRPLLRLIICTAAGFVLTKADLFPLVAARGAGQIALNIALPSLTFSKIVPAFNPQNAGAIGPLLIVAVIYQALGLAEAWLVKQFFWVPHRFRHGIYVAAIVSNWNDIPTSILMSITAESPFNPSTDPDLAVAYVSVFVLVFLVTLFPMGGARLIASDYVGPEVEDDEVRMSVRDKLQENWNNYLTAIHRLLHPRPRMAAVRNVTSELEKNIGSETIREKEESGATVSYPHIQGGRHVTFYPDDTTAVPTEIHSNVLSPAHSQFPSRAVSPIPSLSQIDNTTTTHIDARLNQTRMLNSPPKFIGPFDTASPSSHGLLYRILTRTRTFIRSLLAPPALGILLALPISLIQPVKALFTPIPNSPIPNAPDGQPPLAFILDAATFIGGASVPLGLICLGSALARLHVPRDQWGSLPNGAIWGLAVGKMIVSPILGVLITQGLIKVGLIDGTDKVLVLTCLLLSGLPTATATVFITQVYSGTGDVGVLSAFLIPQYAIMLFSMTGTVIYALQYLF